MRRLATALALLALSASPVLAGPVDFGTFITMFDGIGNSQFTAPVAVDSETQNGASVSTEANLSEAKLHVSNTGVNTGTGAGSNTLFYDTLTFDGSAFTGVFGPTYDLALSAHYEGTFTHSGPLTSGFASGLLRVYDAATTIDSSVFDDVSSLNAFLTIVPERCNSSGFHLLTSGDGAFSFDLACTVTVSAADPTIRVLMHLGTGVNPGGAMTWNLDMLDSGTLSAPFDGRLVTSASGIFPGTTVAAVPEPSTLALLGFGLAAARARRSRKSKA